MRIGVLSDTHGTLTPQVFSFFKDVDEIWHAGDIGSGVLEKLRNFKPVVAVYGNTDTAELRYVLAETELIVREGHKILITHIGGYPGRYERRLFPIFESEKPEIVVCGHSHILKVMYDKGYEHLHINPGAAGRQGIHRVCTLVRFTLDETPHDLQIMEFDR